MPTYTGGGHDNHAEGRCNSRKELRQCTPEVVAINMGRVVITLDDNYANVHERWRNFDNLKRWVVITREKNRESVNQRPSG